MAKEVSGLVVNRPEDVLSISMLLHAFWQGRRIFLFCMVLALVLGGAYLALLSRPVYEASAVIGPSESVSGSSGSSTGSGALAALGVDLGSGPPSEYSKFMQVMASVRLASTLEANHGIMHRIMGRWNAKSRSWRQPDDILYDATFWFGRLLGKPAWTPPAAPQFAHTLSQLVKIAPMDAGGLSRTSNGGFNRVTVEYTDKNIAGALLNYILKDSDDLVRQDRAANSANRVAYLAGQLDRTTDLTLRQNLQNLLLHEQQTLMILHTDKFYSFDMIDPTSVDNVPISPHPIIFLLEMLSVGVVVAAVWVAMLLWLWVRSTDFDVKALDDKLFLDPISIMATR